MGSPKDSRRVDDYLPSLILRKVHEPGEAIALVVLDPLQLSERWPDPLKGHTAAPDRRQDHSLDQPHERDGRRLRSIGVGGKGGQNGSPTVAFPSRRDLV